MDWDNITIHTYNNSADKLADFYNASGVRINDINLGIKLANIKHRARIVEIGCANGRDAAEITKHCAFYEGIDPSKNMLEIARVSLPGISFVQADALTYIYPKNIDIIFAFASLLHVNKEDIPKVIEKTAKSLRLGGILYISLKERETYTKSITKDQYGERMFYYYTSTLIKNFTRNLFNTVYEDHHIIRGSRWFTIALKKK
jgi:trans-aconitate methyltransferase